MNHKFFWDLPFSCYRCRRCQRRFLPHEADQYQKGFKKGDCLGLPTFFDLRLARGAGFYSRAWLEKRGQAVGTEVAAYYKMGGHLQPLYRSQR